MAPLLSAANLTGRPTQRQCRLANLLIRSRHRAANAVKRPGVVALPVVEPEFWRNVNLVTVRGRPYSPGVGALVREAMRKKWFGSKAIAARVAEECSASIAKRAS